MKEADRKLFEGLAEKGEPAGPLDKKPEILEVSEPFWEAWVELQGQRPVGGMGAVGELRREAVTDWLNESGISDRWERERFRSFLSSMDRGYLEGEAKRHEAEARKIEQKAKSAAGKAGKRGL